MARWMFSSRASRSRSASSAPADDRRHRGQAGPFRGPPPPFAHHQFVRLPDGPDHDRLQQPELADRMSSSPSRPRRTPSADCAGSGGSRSMEISGSGVPPSRCLPPRCSTGTCIAAVVAGVRAVRRARDRLGRCSRVLLGPDGSPFISTSDTVLVAGPVGISAASPRPRPPFARSSALLRAVRGDLPGSFEIGGGAPGTGVVGHHGLAEAGVLRRPSPTGGSPRSSTLGPKWVRTSAATWSASFVRPSYMVSRMVLTSRLGLRCALIISMLLQQLAEPLQRVVLALDRDQDLLVATIALTVSSPRDGGQSMRM